MKQRIIGWVLLTLLCASVAYAASPFRRSEAGLTPSHTSVDVGTSGVPVDNFYGNDMDLSDDLVVDDDALISGTLTATEAATFSAGFTVTTGGQTVTAGDVTVTAGDVVIGTTDRGIGSSTAGKTVNVCGGTAGAACNAEAKGGWVTVEGIDFGGTGVGGGIQIEGGAGDATSDVTIATNLDAADILFRGGTTQATHWTIDGATGLLTSADNDITMGTGVVIQSEKIKIHAREGTAGATATVGYVATGVDTGMVTLAASATADTWVIPITGLNVGDTVTAFSVHGQIESAGNTVTIDADLRKHTMAAGDPTDASVGAITQVSKTADYLVDDEKTGLTETLDANEFLYVLITCTTAASTDIQLGGVELTVTRGN